MFTAKRLTDAHTWIPQAFVLQRQRQCIIDVTKSTYLEKRNYNRKSIKKLEGAEGTTLTNEDEILNEIETFYKQLHNSGLDENDLFDLF